jgi:hypothetical protein
VEVIGIVDLSLHTWIRYCGTRFGLKGAYGSLDLSFSDIKDLCDIFEVSDTSCGNYCSNIDYMNDVGVIMQVLGAFAIVLTAVSAAFVILLLFFSKQFIPKVAKSILPIGMGLWVLGTLICIALYVVVTVDASGEASPQGGFGLAIVTALLHVACCVLGYWVVPKLVIRWG